MQRDPRQPTPSTSDEQYRLLVDAVIDYAIYMLDPSGRVSSWNSGARRLKGYEAGEIIGQHFSRFYTDEDRAAGVPDNALASAAREGKFEAEGWRVRKDGSRFWASVVVDAIRDRAGKLVGFAKITRDTTERREAQIELERTREALFQSQKMESLGQLTGGIAHDFNNLLTAILGSLELIGKKLPEQTRAGSDVAGLLANAIQAAQRGAWLTRRMLAFARRENLELRPTNLYDLTRGMTELLRRSLGPSIFIETRFPQTLNLVQADPNQLELALLNLAMNARDAMPEGGPVILAAREEEVRAGGFLAPGRYVCLSVMDRGAGMDEPTLSRAIEPFFTTKGAGKGTGLGLSMVHGMAEQLGGRLVLSSRKGEGTTAELWLPVASEEEPASAQSDDEEAHERVARGLRVLAVDDDALVLMNTALMLESLGHKVFSATSGRQALDILQRGEEIDLVITDEAMPQMRGSQLAAAIQADHPAMPVILATGYAGTTDGRLAAYPRLEKPFSQLDLAEVIEKVAAARRG
ncbi:MAG: PAS domain S-box protein [Enhydrobacter sp.]|nr:MAG: PAS domain S-box protein [Enhydrobacter sp.]